MSLASSNQDFYDSLKPICEYLIENKTKTDYVLNCFYQQESFDLEEMTKAEGNVSQAQKFELRMLSKKEQVDKIKAELTNVKNDKFRVKVAEFLQWVNYQLDPPSMFTQKYPSDLKTCLNKAQRYEMDAIVMTEDINRKFKYLSPNKNTPSP